MKQTNRLSPTPLPDFDPSMVVDLDVREDLRAGREPMSRIMTAVESLPAGSVLHLRTPFQPVPLFAVLGRLGFAFSTEAFADDDWSSWFWKGVITPPRPEAVEESPSDSSEAWDLRHHPAPEPLNLLVDQVGKATGSFDVLLPSFSEMIPELLSRYGWTAAVIATVTGGVRVTVSRGGKDLLAGR